MCGLYGNNGKFNVTNGRGCGSAQHGATGLSEGVKEVDSPGAKATNGRGCGSAQHEATGL